MTRGARIAIGGALTLVGLAGAATVVLLSGRQKDDVPWHDLSEPTGPSPRHWSLLVATEEQVVFGPKPAGGRPLGKRPGRADGATLVAMDPAERVLWEVPFVGAGRFGASGRIR